MDVLGLPDPSDYNAPTNDPVADHDRRPPAATAVAAATETTAEGAAAGTTTTAPSVDTATTAAPAAPAPAAAPAETGVGQDTFPSPAPTVEGVDVTESVYQQGA